MCFSSNERPMKDKMLSLCIPTNGVIEWVIPVLDSIYAQNIDVNLFEVIVTDNGKNEKFQEYMKKYIDRYPNLVYKKTEAYQFLNQIEAFRMAQGRFVKFINHRMKMLPGSLEYFITFVKKNQEKKPTIFFLNQSEPRREKIDQIDTFDLFIRHLAHWSSWSGGLAFWKEDFDQIPQDIQYNSLFPHMSLLFSMRKKKDYIIDNTHLLEEIPVGTVSKGKYNLFYAFAAEYMFLICDLFRKGDISEDTLLLVKEDNKRFIIDLYLEYVLLKHPCSYELSDYDKYINLFYDVSSIQKEAVKKRISLHLKRIRKK